MKLAKGIKVKDLNAGVGPEVAPQDIVHFHCTGRLSKGEVVFTTRGDAPWQIRVGARDAFVALDQGLIGMRAGGRRELRVPPHLTYYEQGTYPNLPKTAVLIYEIELLRIAEHWDHMLHIRKSPIYSEQTKALERLERRFQELEPSTDSEFQRVQLALFKSAEEDYRRHREAAVGTAPNDSPH